MYSALTNLKREGSRICTTVEWGYAPRKGASTLSIVRGCWKHVEQNFRDFLGIKTSKTMGFQEMFFENFGFSKLFLEGSLKLLFFTEENCEIRKFY